MAVAGHNLEVGAADAVDEPMLVVDAARGPSGQRTLEHFWLAESGSLRIPLNIDDQLADAPRRTPRSNEALEQRLGDFATLAEGLDYAARGETGFDFYSPRGELAHVLPYRRLRQEALATALRLLNSGLARGDRVAVVAETGPAFMTVFFACQYAGLVPCPVPYSMHIGGRDAYVARIAGMLGSAGAAAVITPGDLEDQVAEAASLAGVPVVLYLHENQLTYPLPEGVERDYTYAYINYLSALTADRVVFNSQHHYAEFMEALPVLLSDEALVSGPKANASCRSGGMDSSCFFPIST